ncbi:uncharacterized protein LOC143838930 [Paroedura picta]|uniref:uncharacterized protein LOC143838930 n=1 Tax=Paroedura picta TaxID=143630 RepID=UPI0040572ADE
MGWHQLLAAGCTIFTLFILILVVTSHQWLRIESAKQMYHSGIWKICTKMVCNSIIAKIAYFQIIRFLFVLALFCSFFCTSYMLFTYRYLPSYPLPRFLCSATGSFATGFLTMLATMIYTVFVTKRGITNTARVTYQPTFYLAWCLGPIFAISGFVNLLAHYFMPVHRISLADQDSLSRSSISDVKMSVQGGCQNDMVLGSMRAF